LDSEGPLPKINMLGLEANRFVTHGYPTLQTAGGNGIVANFF
jgi:hypothetical protein